MRRQPSPAEEFMSGAHLLVLWRVFEHCNLGCHFCGYSKHLKRARAIADVNRVVSFGAILGEYARVYGRSVLVSWLGGEPLLWPQLPRLSRILNREFGIQLGVTSNGLPLERHSVRSS